MALFRKLFYRKPPDGLLEICERVYVFDCCFTTEAFEEERDYFGYVGGIVTQLREYYPDASILAFNFREGETQSQIGSALGEYDMTLMEYPRHYEGCPLLPMEVIHHFLRSSESWFSLGMQNLLLMHCERGGWPVLAFMLAALLIYRKHYSGEQKTLDMVYKQAPRELLHLMSPLNPIPSQLRYLQYVSRRNVATQWPPLDRGLTLDCIIIRMIPNFDGEGGCRPVFRIYGQDPCLVSDRSPKVLFSTPKKSRNIRHYKQAECSIVKVDINCHIQGDVVLECISLHNDMQREVMMFRVMFNTAFIRSNILMLNLDEIDILWDAKDLFPKDFRAEVLFSEMDSVASKVPVTSKVPVDTSCFEDKDGLPVEAFAKVQEIFSSVDWLSPERDAAVEVLQQLAVSNTVIEAYSHVEKSQVNKSLAALEAKSPLKSPTDLSPKLSPNADVSRNQAEPHFSPTKSGAIISSKQTLITSGDHSPPTSTSHHQPSEEKTHLSPNQQSDPNETSMAIDGFPLSEVIPLYTRDLSPPTSTSDYQPSEEKTLHLSPNQQSDPNEIGMAKDGFPLSEVIPLYPKDLHSAPPSQPTKKTLHLSPNQQPDPNESGMAKDGFPLNEVIPLYPKDLHSAPPSQPTKNTDVAPGGSLLSPAPCPITPPLEDKVRLQSAHPSTTALEDDTIIMPDTSYPSAEGPAGLDKVIEDGPTKSKTPLSAASSAGVLIKAPRVENPPPPPPPPIHSSQLVDMAKSTGVGSMSPSTTISSNLNAIQVTEGGQPSPHLSSPKTDDTLKTAPPPAPVNENSTSIHGPTPPASLPPLPFPFKEFSECAVRPLPHTFTPYLTDSSAADRLASCSPPPPPFPPASPHGSSSIGGGPPLSALPISSYTGSGSISPSTTISSNLNAIQVTEGGQPSPHLSSPKTGATLNTEPPSPALINENSTSIHGSTPPASLPPLPSPFKEFSECAVRPLPHTFTPYLTDSSAADRLASCSSPPPPPLLPVSPHESSSIGGGPPLSAPPPSPSPSSPQLKEHYAPEVVHPPPSTQPLKDIPVTEPVPCTSPSPPAPPRPPKESISGGESTTFSVDDASNLALPVTDSLVTQSMPCPPLLPPFQPPKEISDGGGPPCPPRPLHSGQGSPNLQTFPPPSPPPPPASPTTGSSILSAPPPPFSPTTRKSSIPSAPPPPFSPTTRSSSVPSASPPPFSPSTRSPSVPSAPPPPTSPRSPCVPSAPPPPASPRSPCVPSAPPPPASPRSPCVPSVPPPPANHTSRSLPGPPSPPPPFSLTPGTKEKSLLSRTRNNQTKKLKPLHWLKISRAVSGSLWAEAQKSGEASRAPEIDISELETLFSAAAPNSDGGSGRKTGSRGSMGSKPEKVQLIDHRRAYNCEIMLSKVKIPLPDMLSSVLALEDSGLDVDQVENLIKFCPTKEEMELLKGYKGEKDKLGKCEQFFLEMMQVPRTEFKLRVYSFKLQFHSQVSDLRNNLSVVNSAADQIRGSTKLKRVMQTILNLGNALNQGTARGSAVGFRLDSLLKLTETRARNNKMTLMHYLCKMLSDQLPELLDFWKDLSSLELASKIQLKFLAEEMQAINKGLEKVMQELTLSESDGPVSEEFRKALKEFLCFSEGEVRSLASLYAGVGRNVDSLILYFGEDPARCPFEQVISTLMNFVRMFKQSHEENCKQIESDKKKAEKEAMERMKKNAPDTGQLLQSEVRSVK